MGIKRKTKNRAAVRSCGHPSPDIRVASLDRESEMNLSSREGSPGRYSRSVEKRNRTETTCNNTGQEKFLFSESVVGSSNTHLKSAKPDMSVTCDCSENTGDVPVLCCLYENQGKITISCIMSRNTGSVPVLCDSFQNAGYVPVTCKNTVTPVFPHIFKP